MELKLKIYDENNEVKREVEAAFVDIKMGTIRRLMKLLKVDDIQDQASLLKLVSDVWDELTKILDQIFPDVTEEEWDYVSMGELIPTVIKILKGSFTQMAKIPNDPKN